MTLDHPVDIETYYPREYLMEWRRLRVECKIRGLLKTTEHMIDWRLESGHANDIDLRHMKRVTGIKSHVG